MKSGFKNTLLRIKNTKKHITIMNKIVSKIMISPNIKSSYDTADEIISKKYSVSRYGDGEFKLIYGKDLLFQQYDKELQQRLIEILKSNLNNHIVCIPRQIVDTSELNERSKYYWENYLNLNRYKIYKVLDRQKIYYDAFITRFYIDYEDKKKAKLRIEKLKQLWSEQEIVIIEGYNSRLGIGNDLFKECKDIKRVLCPSLNAYSKYKNILESIKKIEKNKLILIALGPTATVLAYDLAQLGYRALDIGHIDIEYEWFLRQVDEKCPIENKYVGEAVDGDVLNNIKDDKYEKEILYKITM